MSYFRNYGQMSTEETALLGSGLCAASGVLITIEVTLSLSLLQFILKALQKGKDPQNAGQDHVRLGLGKITSEGGYIACRSRLLS